MLEYPIIIEDCSDWLLHEAAQCGEECEFCADEREEPPTRVDPPPSVG
jgi:hypothetical protein